MVEATRETVDLLRLTLVPGLGPTTIARAVRRFGSARDVLGASVDALASLERVGPSGARKIYDGMKASEKLVDQELREAERLGVRLVGIGDGGYPPLLRLIPDPPMVLYVRGSLEPSGVDKYAVAIVGSRRCTQYGLEQTRRFATQLAASGIAVVSGGARGVDTAAHQAAVMAKGRTAVVLGCGLAHTYPPENGALFETIVEECGCVMSELPMKTAPTPQNFPARNRIVSGMSLGVLVVEAPVRSGALITARCAVDDHNREAFAVPGRVDAKASAGCLELIKQGAAALVSEPADVIGALENAARHLHMDTIGAFAPNGGMLDETETVASGGGNNASLFRANGDAAQSAGQAGVAQGGPGLSEAQMTVMESLRDGGQTVDQIASSTGLGVTQVRTELTMLEMRRRVRREGSRIVAV